MTWIERTCQHAIPYGIEPQYERALEGFHPAYFSDVAVLAHGGWYPSWSLMWAHRDIPGAAWQQRASVAASWTERT